jgi:hypothetical protein
MTPQLNRTIATNMKPAPLALTLLSLALTLHAEPMLRIYPGAATNTLIVALACPSGQGAWWDVAAGPVPGATNDIFILPPNQWQVNSPVRTYVISGIQSTNGLFFWPVVRR